MKIAILSLRSRFGDVTGDCVQAQKTTSALNALGENAARFYLDCDDGVVYDNSNAKLGEWQEVFASHDIIHAIPPIPSKFIERLPKVKAKLACSTVFWRSLTYTRVVHINQGGMSLPLLKDYLRDALALIGIKQLRSFEVYDLLLPNSEDEIRVLSKYAHLKKGAEVVAVPNAVDDIPDDTDVIPRSSLVPSEDYVLVPGFFAPRKNQLMLIKALAHSEHPVVFMGKGPLLEMCRSCATSNMLFIGHIMHGTRDFYSIVKNARVVCLPSNCETPGIAGLEAAAFGARPVVPYEGGTCQYYGWDAEYHDPLSATSLLLAVERAWHRGRMLQEEALRYRRTTWKECANRTREAYLRVLHDAPMV